jgi:hypothetical protein
MASGAWRINVLVPTGGLEFGSVRIFYGSSRQPSGYSELNLVKNTSKPTTFDIADNRSKIVAAGLTLGQWHSIDYAWDMSSSTNCRFSVAVDGGEATSSAPSLGSPADCYGHIYKGNVIGSMGLFSYLLGPNQIYFDAIGGIAPAPTTTPATTTPPCATDCNDNVMFLPGIEASRLYRPDGEGEKKLWEPGSDADAMELAMNPDGTSARSDIYARDILDNAYVPSFGNVYKSFIESMDELVSSGKINEWKPIAYDWRYGLEQLLTSGKVIGADGSVSYTAATSSPYIVQELKRLAGTSRSGKVTIIAHSNGGLLAKALMIRLGPEASKYVDRLILVASPQVGTPDAIASMLHGTNQGISTHIPFRGKKLSAETARQLGDGMPGIYNLLPSSNYFTYVDDPVVTIDPKTMSDWVNAYGSAIHSQERQHTFLIDTPNIRNVPSTNDLVDPTILSSAFLTEAETVHQQLDSWVPPPDVKVIQIAGWGIPNTIKGVSYARGPVEHTLGTQVELKPEAQFTVNGDGTVVTPSALWISTSTNAENYWVDLNTYNKQFISNAVFGYNPITHAGILETEQLRNFIKDVIIDNIQPISSYSYFSTSVPTSSNSKLRYTLHSPLTLNFYDDQGRHTGISTSTGVVEEQIPGTYYTELGDVKYVFTDTDMPVHIVMDGYATSTFTFNVVELKGDAVTASTTWKDMPVTPHTAVNLDATRDISTLSALKIDTNGDGTTDLTLSPKLDGIVILPAPLTVTANNATTTLGSSIPNFSATLSGFVEGDTASSSGVTGSAACSTTATSTSAIGTYPITCTVGSLSFDKYIFQTFVPGTLSVVYRYDGFLQPINDIVYQSGQSASVFKGGSTIPVKFQLKRADGTLVQASSVPVWVVPVRGAALAATVNESVTSTTTSAGDVYKWDSDSKQYIYNWSTKGLAVGYWYTIFTKLDDGTIYSIKIGLK